MSNLAEHLKVAAASAIGNEGPTLQHQPGQVRRVTIVLDVANNATGVTATTVIERAAPTIVQAAVIVGSRR